MMMLPVGAKATQVCLLLIIKDLVSQSLGFLSCDSKPIAYGAPSWVKLCISPWSWMDSGRGINESMKLRLLAVP